MQSMTTTKVSFKNQQKNNINVLNYIFNMFGKRYRLVLLVISSCLNSLRSAQITVSIHTRDDPKVLIVAL